MSIKLTFKDGHWYIDVRQGSFGQFKPDKRTGTLYDIETLRCLTGPMELVKCAS